MGGKLRNQSASACEICGQEPAISFSWFRDRDAPSSQPNGEWKLAGKCTVDTEDYYIEFDSFFATTAQTLTCIEQLEDKTWIDLNDFMLALARLAGTGLRAA